MPDHASVNLSEPAAIGVCELLLSKGVGIEAGLASVADTRRLIESGLYCRVSRMLFEVDSGDLISDMREANQMLELMESQRSRKSTLLHGFDDTVWPFVEMAARHRFSTRVGLEDGTHLPEGSVAASNAELVAAAMRIVRPR